MKKEIVIVFFIPLIMLSCVNDYNPFENMDNIDIKIEKTRSSIGDNDTFSIFKTESLTVYATVWEQIDSFIVQSDSNRLWNSNFKKIAKPGPVEHTLYFSWNDTGSRSVRITMYRHDGKVSSKSVNFLVVSSMRQKDIISEAGVACTLFTAGIMDPGLTYHWYFGEYYGRKIEFEYSKPGPRATEILIGQQGGVGSLWVEDTNGKCSPKVAFNYRFTDNTPPEVIVNSGLTKGDTVITGDSIFLLNLLIRDKGIVRNVSINDSADYKRETTVNGELVTHLHTNMHRATPQHPFADTVIATDAAGLTTTKIIYSYFSTTGPKTKAVILSVLSPSVESWRTIDSTMTIVYKLLNYSTDTVKILASRNGIGKAVDVVLPGTDTTILWDCPLSSGATNVKITAFAKDTITSKYLVIERSVDNVDTVHPLISHVLVNGNEGDRFVLQADQAVISFLAFDNSGKLRSVTVDGQNVSMVAGKMFQYTDTVNVSHNGGNVIIRVIDQAGLVTEDTIYVRYNTAPVFVKDAISGRFVLGERRSDTIAFTDGDGDTVTPSITVVGQGQTVQSNFTLNKINANQAVITWLGPATFTEGKYTMRVALWDGSQTVTAERGFNITKQGPIDLPAYNYSRTILSSTDTLSGGVIDRRRDSIPTRIEITIASNLKTLSKNDSIIIENAQKVVYVNDLGKVLITIDSGRGRVYDTVNVLVKGIDGVVDTVGRIAIVYPPRSPNLISSLSYWFALDKGVSGGDFTLRGTNAIEWWNNRVNAIPQFYSYTSGAEPVVDTLKTPGGKPSLKFGQKAILINYPGNQLGIGGNWPSMGYTVFFVAKRTGVTDGILWSSSDYDSVHFGVGVSAGGKLAAFNRGPNQSTTTITESSVRLDTSWNVIIFMSNGRSSSTDTEVIRMGLYDYVSDSTTTSITGISSNLMLGSANKHMGRFAWPGNIAETVSYQRVLTISECREVAMYLAGKHKINK